MTNIEGARAALHNTFHAEKEAVDGLMSLIDTTIPEAVDLLSQSTGRAVISGMGKSGHIAQKIATTFSSLGVPSFFLHPTEAMHGDLGILQKGDVLVAISKSGTNRELVRVISYAKELGIRVISITSGATSPLAMSADVALVFPFEQEGSPYNLAPMASATASLVVGHLLATGVCIEKGFTPEDFARVHPGGTFGLQLHTVGERMREKEESPVVLVGTSFVETLRAMTEKKNAGVAAVVDHEGKLAGVVSDGDIRRFLLENSSIDGKTSGDVMTRSPKTILTSATLREALEMMETYKITSLFVVQEDNTLLGVVHMHDILAETL